MTAYLLVLWVGIKVIVPGVETEQECKRLGELLTAPNSTQGYTCIAYHMRR